MITEFQKEFLKQAIVKTKQIPGIIGLAIGGSWITNELDQYSDLDLVLVSENILSDDIVKMTQIASGLGNLLNAFTGEHVGEPRLLICMYDNPLLHVDIKFVTAVEFKERVEDPEILWERDKRLSNIIQSSEATWPELDFQWIEDRFWTWIHYTALKIGRGELFEALDCISFLRTHVISPLMQVKNGQLPRALRKVEFNFDHADLNDLKNTIPVYNRESIICATQKIIQLYEELSKRLFPEAIICSQELKEKSNEYLKKVAR